MSSEQNKAIMRRFNDASVVNDHETLEGLLAADFVIHQADGPGNREAYLQHLSYYAAAFSDATFTLDEQIAEGDKVVTRGRFSATHTGDFQGMPPSGKRFSIDAVLFDRIVDGQIVEHRSQTIPCLCCSSLVSCRHHNVSQHELVPVFHDCVLRIT